MPVRCAIASAVVFGVLVGTASAASGPALVGEWPLDEGGGTVAADVSGLGNDGTLQGAAQWVSGVQGTALAFDGTSASVRIPDSPSLEPATVSVSAWVQSAGSPGDWKYVLAKGATGCVAASYALYTGSDGGLAFYVGNDGGLSYRLSPDAGPGVWDGRWHVVTGTFDGATERLYVDGRQIGDGTPDPGPISYGLSDSNDLFIGHYAGCARAFTGRIDDPRVWAGALTDAAVQDAVSLSSPPGPPAAGAPPSQSPSASGGHDGSAPTGGAGPGSPAAAPFVSHLRLNPAVFRALAAGPPSTHSTRGRGTIVRYTDSQAAQTTLEVLVLRPGVRGAGACLPVPAHAAHGARCRRWVRVGSLAHRDVAGPNAVRFDGRLAGRALAPGSYRLEVTAAVHALRGVPVAVPFRVVG